MHSVGIKRSRLWGSNLARKFPPNSSWYIELEIGLGFLLASIRGHLRLPWADKLEAVGGAACETASHAAPVREVVACELGCGTRRVRGRARAGGARAALHLATLEKRKGRPQLLSPVSSSA